MGADGRGSAHLSGSLSCLLLAAALAKLADSAVTEAERREARLIVIGMPGANRLMDELADRLPVRFGPEVSVTIEARTVTGVDLVTITNTRSPWNRERLLRTWSADTAAALALPWEESSSGGSFPQTNAAWVAPRGRLLGRSDAGIQDRRSYIFAHLPTPLHSKKEPIPSHPSSQPGMP